jgi:hypothetical protein
MKVERKLSDLFAEERKQNENMKTKTEICGMKMETDFFLRKWKRKTERRFPAEQMRKRKFLFPTNMEFPFYGCFAWPI